MIQESQKIRHQAGTPVEAKTPMTRLLDLTAGWSAFVEQENGAYPDAAVSAHDLAGLYQEAGEVAFDAGEAGPDEEIRRVRAFVNERLLPLLLRTG